MTGNGNHPTYLWWVVYGILSPTLDVLYSMLYGGFLNWGAPKMDGLKGQFPIGMDDLVVPLFQETSI